MKKTINDINKTIEIIQKFKENPEINTLTLWFEGDYVIEINKRNNKTILYQFETNSEKYYYQGEYRNLLGHLKEGYIIYGKKYQFMEMDVE